MSSETAILLRFTAGAAKQILLGNKVNGKLLTMEHVTAVPKCST